MTTAGRLKKKDMFDVDVVLVKLQTSLLGKLGICEPNKAFALQWGWWIWFFWWEKKKCNRLLRLPRREGNIQAEASISANAAHDLDLRSAGQT